MKSHIEIQLPKDRPEGATHYSPFYTLCWEKHENGKSFIYDGSLGWRPMVRSGKGYPIINQGVE